MSTRDENAGGGANTREMRRPRAVAVSAGPMFVADARNSRESQRRLHGVASCGSAAAVADPGAGRAPLREGGP